jgi:rare lipoprotein A
MRGRHFLIPSINKVSLPSYFLHLLLLCLISLTLAYCAPSSRFAALPSVKSSDKIEYVQEGDIFVGEASYYAEKFHGRKTANGEIFDMYIKSAAHKTLPFDTILEVTNLENRKSVIVRVNDRGPFVQGRILDLSFAAAKEIDMIASGVARVRIKILKTGTQ